MARRRSAVHAAAPADEFTLPTELAAGPCVETWADREPHGVLTSPAPWFRALRAWQTAVEVWADRSGWTVEGRPAGNAMNLARTRQPWSRTYLLEQGRRALVDYLDGRSPVYPVEPGRKPWEPMTA